jgi:hypothetical protein
MRFFAVTFLFVTLAISVTAAPSRTFAARSCRDQNNVCVELCMKYGTGRSRMSNPHPMPADFCRSHCAGWYSGCNQSGCWNGDLVQLCGLTKR